MEKRKVLLTAAIAGLFAASAVMTNAPAFADETAAPPAAGGDKASCKGGSCKGEEGKAAGDAAAPTGDKASCKGGSCKGDGHAKAKKGGKKGKAKKKKAEPTG